MCLTTQLMYVEKMITQIRNSFKPDIEIEVGLEMNIVSYYAYRIKVAEASAKCLFIHKSTDHFPNRLLITSQRTYKDLRLRKNLNINVLYMIDYHLTNCL